MTNNIILNATHASLNSRYLRWLPSLLLGLMLVLMILSSLHKPLSFDEPHNLDYGRGFLQNGADYYTTGQRMPVLAINALSCLSYQCSPEILDKSETKRLAVRFPSMLATLLLGGIIWRWSRELFGNKAALLSLALFALNPNFIAHGKQITSDGYTALLTTWTFYLFWKLLKQGGQKYFILWTLSVSACVLAKFSAVILFPIFLLLFLLEKFIFKSEAIQRLSWPKFLKCCAIFLIAWWFLVNAGYLFKGTFRPMKQDPWESTLVKRIASFNLPAPFPSAFMKGLDYSFLIEEHDEYGRGSNYILGKLHRKGRWYSFPIMLLLKNPIAFFPMLFLALAACRVPGAKWKDTLYLGIPFLSWLIFFSVGCDLQIGIRYILSTLPFLFIYAGKLLLTANNVWRIGVIGFLTAWYSLSSLSYHPFYMSYFNEVIGERINAYKYLSDSNLDWENLDYFMNRFKAKHPGIKFHEDFEAIRHPQSGFYLVSAIRYTGVIDEQETNWLREFKPLRHVFYSHYLLYVPEDRVKALNK